MRSSRIVSLLLIVLVLATAAVMYAKPVEDGDIWFHLAYARQMIQNHTLIPDHTAFSWTPSSNQEIYCAWIPELILYGLYQAWGVASLFATRYFCLFFFLTLAARFAWRNKIFDNPVTWLICLMGVLMSQSGLLIKPEMFSYMLMGAAVFLYFSLKRSDGKRWWPCYLFPVLLLVWINTHGGVIFGITFLGLLFAGEILNGILSREEMLPMPMRRHFLTALVICGPVTLLTPYGWRYPVQLVQNFLLNRSESIQGYMAIGSYQTIFHPKALWLHYVDLLVLACLILAMLLWPKIRDRKPDWTLILTNLALGIIYARFLRGTYFWAMLFTFTALHYLAARPGKVPGKGDVLQKLIPVSVMVVMVFLSTRGMYQAYSSPQFGFWINYVNPVEEAEIIRDNFKGLRLGNDYEAGSYLLWALWPETKIFIDSRYFPYKSWFDEFMGFRNGKDVESFLAKYPCDLWCFTYGFPGVSYFVRSPEWKLVHYGPSACIFARKELPIPAGVAKEDVFHGYLSIFQAVEVFNFSLKIDDIPTAMKLADHIGQGYVIPKKKELSYQVHLQLGSALIKHGMAKEAMAQLDTAMQIDAGKPEPYTLVGDAYRKMGDQDRAIAQYLKALGIKPDFAQALQNLSVAYTRKGRYDDALVPLRRLADSQPGNPEPYYNIACIYALQGNVDESVRWLKVAVEKGFHNWTLLRNDADLKSIRETGFYRELVESGDVRADSLHGTSSN